MRLVGETLALAVVPVPERVTVWGLPVALSVIVSEAVRLPVAEGVKVTLTVQFDPAATEVPQLLVCPKSLELIPVTNILVKFSDALPEFVSTTTWAGLPVPTD